MIYVEQYVESRTLQEYVNKFKTKIAQKCPFNSDLESSLLLAPLLPEVPRDDLNKVFATSELESHANESRTSVYQLPMYGNGTVHLVN